MGYRCKKDQRWPGGKIYYMFDPKSPKDDRDVVEAAMGLWEHYVNDAAKTTLISFHKAKGNETHYVKMHIELYTKMLSTRADAGGIGRAENVINFQVYGEESIKSIPHELAHTIGLVHEHEQNHPDELKNWKDELRLYCPANEFLAVGYRKKAKQYVVVGDYDLQSITHYPKRGPLKWTKEEYNANNGAKQWEVLNYPSKEDVKKKDKATWKPSPGNLETIIDLYKD